MKPAFILLAATAALAISACDANESTQPAGNTSGPIEAVAPPEGGDWTKMVRQTPEGGFVMGNPNADVKIVEYASMTCPHCAEFDENGAQQLIDQYVKTGRVSFEIRNFVRDPFDLAASLITRCGGADRFFPLTHAMFADQQEWTGQLQQVPPAQFQEITNLPPERQFVEIAQLAGFQQWAAQRGLPSARTSACLADRQQIERLVQMSSDVRTQYPDFRGTPSFTLNGELLENTATWAELEPQIRDAVG